MSYEQKIINYFEKNYKKIGDDCAYINSTKQLISSDTLVENKHFDLKHFTPQNIAHRLFLSNYSDIQSSGGVPKYVLLNICLLYTSPSPRDSRVSRMPSSA